MILDTIDTIEAANRDLAAATAELRRQHRERLAAALVGRGARNEELGCDGVVVSIRSDECGMYAVCKTASGALFKVGV